MRTVTLEALNRNPLLASRLIGRRVVVWSGEHGAYWRDNASGYVVEIEDAGVYAFEAAHFLTEHMGPEKQIRYEVVA
jgi:hypothetical protein